MSENRSVNRARTLLSAKAVFKGGLSSLDCFVKDLSPGGARLMFEGREYVPNTFQLNIHRNGQSFKSHVRWREHNFVGVSFDEHSPAEKGPTERVKELEAENAVLRRRIADMAKRLDSYGDSERSAF